MHPLESMARALVDEGRLILRHHWHYLRPGDWIRVARSDIRGHQIVSRERLLVVSRVRMRQTYGTGSTREWTRVVFLGPGPKVMVEDV